MIGSLQSLRFIFAIMIFLHHASLFEAGGSCGVSFFMILSGFVMSVGYETKVQTASFSYKNFIAKRLIRVYPLHLLCLLGFIIFHFFSLSAGGWFKLLPNLLLLQSWIPERSYYFSGNAVSWCLSCMLFFYLSFPFLIKGLNKYSTRTICITGILVLLIYSSVLFTISESRAHPLLYISPLFRLVDFTIGVLLYRLYSKLEKQGLGLKIRNLSTATKSFWELSLVLILAAMLIIFPNIPQRYIMASYWWLITPPFILSFALFNKLGGVISTLLNKPFLKLLGEFSFSFYMIHQLALNFFRGCIHQLHIDIPWGIMVIPCFLATIVISYLVYIYYEKPIASILKKKL